MVVSTLQLCENVSWHASSHWTLVSGYKLATSQSAYCEIALQASSLVAGEAREQPQHGICACQWRGRGVNVIDMLLAVRDDPVRAPTDHRKWISDISISHSFLGGRQTNAFQLSLCHTDDEFLGVCVFVCQVLRRLPLTILHNNNNRVVTPIPEIIVCVLGEDVSVTARITD